MKCHKVREKDGKIIADKWKETTKKKAWSCGFCGHFLPTFGDRLKHIAAHFQRGQTLDEWSTTKEVEGLLSQPGMVKAWEKRLATASLGQRSVGNFWEKHLVTGLRGDLEAGPSDTKHAAALSEAAYEARQSSRALINGDMSLASEPSAIMPTSGYDPIAQRAFIPNSHHDQSRFITNPAEALHHGVPVFGDSMALNNHGTFSSGVGSTSVSAYWLLDPGQPWSLAAAQYNNLDGYGYQHSNPTPDTLTWPTPAGLSDEADADDPFGWSL